MPADEIIDLTESGRRAAAFRRRRLMRVLVPVQFVLILLVAIAAILYFNYQSNRREALELSDVVIQTTADRIETEVVSYLGPAEQMVRLGSTKAGKYPDLPFGLNPSYNVGLDAEGNGVNIKGPTPLRLQALSIDMLETYSQFAMVNIADGGGNFVMPKRMPGGNIDTKIIDRRSGRVPEVQWVRRDGQGRVLGLEPVPADRYDPRVRPWYIGARDRGSLYWTSVYILFTDRKPGVTAAYPILKRDGELAGVFSVDIELDAVCSFLSELDIGETGRAVIVDPEGRIVAHPDIDQTMKQVDGRLETAPIQELGDPALIRVYNRYRIEGTGAFALDVDGERYRGSATELPDTVGSGWAVLLVVPEDDYVGFVNQRTRQAALMSLGVVGIVGVFTCFVVVQGVRADNTAQKVIEREGELLDQGGAFAKLSDDPDLLDPTKNEALRRLTEDAANAVRVQRVGVWRVEGDRMVCLDAYDRSGAGHVSGTELDLRTMPGLAELFQSGELLAAAEVAGEPGLRELDELYLTPLRHESLLLCPIRGNQQTLGVIFFEASRQVGGWSDITRSFARSLAGLLRVRLAGADDRATQISPGIGTKPAEGDVVEPALAPHTELGASSRDSATNGDAADWLDATVVTQLHRSVHEHTAVLVVACIDQRPGHGGGAESEHALSLLHFISCLAEQWAQDRSEVRIVLGGERLTIAAGMDHDTSAAGQQSAVLLAHLALRLQQLSREQDPADRVAVKMGLDVGTLYAAELGGNGAAPQLTGPCLAVADQLAHRASGDAIQVSERAFLLLRSRFLLQRRGRFFAGGIGTLGTYFLTDELEPTA
ncbi:MAG: cache domain-containing protein [Planctomycetota bacterium]